MTHLRGADLRLLRLRLGLLHAQQQEGCSRGWDGVGEYRGRQVGPQSTTGGRPVHLRGLRGAAPGRCLAAARAARRMERARGGGCSPASDCLVCSTRRHVSPSPRSRSISSLAHSICRQQKATERALPCALMNSLRTRHKQPSLPSSSVSMEHPHPHLHRQPHTLLPRQPAAWAPLSSRGSLPEGKTRCGAAGKQGCAALPSHLLPQLIDALGEAADLGLADLHGGGVDASQHGGPG